jgi:hypothetical protein
VGVWACGRVGVWACGRVGVWACGRVGMDVHVGAHEIDSVLSDLSHMSRLWLTGT